MDHDYDFELQNFLGDDMDIDNIGNDEGVPAIPHFNLEDPDFSAHIEDSLRSNRPFLDDMNIGRVDIPLSNYCWGSAPPENQKEASDDVEEINRTRSTESKNDNITSVSITEILQESLKDDILVDSNNSIVGNDIENEFEFIDNLLSDESRFDLTPNEMENILQNSGDNENILHNHLQGDQNENKLKDTELGSSSPNYGFVQTIESAENKKVILDRFYNCIFDEVGVQRRSDDHSRNRYGCRFEENPSLTTVGGCFNREKLWEKIKPELLKRSVITDEFVSSWCKCFVQIMKIANICPSCKVMFQFKESFSGHLINRGDGKIMCPYLCKKPLSTNYLQRHIRDLHKVKNTQVNGEEQKFTCDEEGCTRWFMSRQALKLHKNISHGRKTRSCTNCRAQFESLDDLLRHRIVAHGLKEGEQQPFKCEIEGCNFVTASKRGLFSHRKRTHNIVNEGSIHPFLCPMKGCTAACRTEKGLHNHMSSKHALAE